MAGNETEAEDFDFKEYAFSPKTIEVNGVQVEDWTGAELDKIFLANKKDILEKPRPSWIPEFDGEGLEADGWLPACAKDYATGDYYVQSRTKVGERDRIRHGAVAGKEAVWETKILKMPLDLLSATIDYYLKRKRAELKRDGSARTVSLPRALNRMTLSRYDAIAGLMGLCECYKNEPKEIFKGDKEAKANGYDLRLNSFVFTAQWTPLLQAVKDKRLDMNLQKLDAISMFEKGEETGYGKSGRTDALFEKFGVMAKKQNGSKFRSDELSRAEEALSKVWAHYGNLSELAKKADLTFSFAADTFQHARKAQGLYRRVPDTDEEAIGVSFFQGKQLSGRALPDLILAHEAAHWLDSEKGKSLRCHFASDKDGTLEREIALKFKKLFRERNGKKAAIGGSGKKVPGEYWSRTCECLARAMEEHYGLKMGLDCYEEDFAFLPKDVFMKELAPLCERLIEENKERLLLSAPAVLKASADGIEKSEKEFDMENKKAASEEAQNSLFENETEKEGNAGNEKEFECLDLGALFDSLESDNGNAETAFGYTLRRDAAPDGQFYYDLLGGSTGGLRLCCDGEECAVLERGDGWVKLVDEANIGDTDLEGLDTTFKLSEAEFNIAAKKISLSSPEKNLEQGFGEEATTQELDSAIENLGYYFEYDAGMRLVDIYESESGDLAGSYGDGGFGYADGAEIPSDVFGDVVSLAERYFRASAEVETNGPEQAAEAADSEFKKTLDVSTASVPRESDLAEALRKEGYADGGNLANEILNKYNRLPQGDEYKGLFLDESGTFFVRDYLKDENHVVALSALAEEARADIAERAAARIPAFEIVRNEEKGRVNIKFPADRKHPRFEEITKALKSHGWKFAPSTKMWYPLKVEGSEGFAKALLAEFSELKGPNVQEKVTENAGESDKGAYKDLISELREEYDKIYNMDSAEQAKILRERNARFNELSKNEEFNQLVAEIANERGDFISSDREVAALMVVMDKNGMLDKFSGKIESKIKAAPSPTDDKKQEEYKLNAFAEKTGINLNNHLVLENRKIVLERGSFALGGLTKKEFEDLKSKLDKANVSYKEEVRGETKVCLVDLSVLEDSETEKKDIIEEEKSRLNGTLKVYTRLSVEGREVSFDPDFNTSFAARPYDEDGRRKFVILEEKRGEHATHITSVVADLPYIDDWKKATLETLKMLAISEEGLKNGFEHKFYSYEYVPELLSRIELVDSKTGEDAKKDLLPEEVLEASDPEKAFLKEQEKKVNGFELLGLPYVKADWSESGEVKGGTVWGFEEADKALAELNERLGPKGGYYKTELKVLYPTEGEDEYGSYAFRFDLGSVENFGTLCDYIRETCSYPKEVFPGLEKAWKSVFAHSVEDNYVMSVDTIVKRTVDRMKPAFEEAKKALSEALKAESKVMSCFLVEASAADAAESGVSAAKKKCAEEFEKILAQLAASTDPVLLGCDVKSLSYESCKAWSDFSSKNALTDLLCEEARLSPPADEFDWTAWRKMMDAIPSVSDFGKLLSAARQESRDAALAATLGPKAENFSEALSAFAKRRPNLSPLEAGKILMKAVRPEELPKISDWLKGQGCVSEEATAKKFAEWISGKGAERKTETKEPKKQPASYDRELF